LAPSPGYFSRQYQGIFFALVIYSNAQASGTTTTRPHEFFEEVAEVDEDEDEGFDLVKMLISMEHWTVLHHWSVA
jgi:hypothetical protein